MVAQSGDDIERYFHKLDSPHQDVGLFRVSGVFPTFSADGSKLAFVDNEFKAVWVADSKGLRIVYEVCMYIYNKNMNYIHEYIVDDELRFL